MNWFYTIILYLFKPILKRIAEWHAPYTHKKMTGKDYYHLRDELKIGTVLLSKTYGEASNIINPTEMKHSALYVGRIMNDEICYVIEAVGKGVKLTDLVTFVTSKDELVVCKPNFITTDEQEFGTQEKALNYIGRSYDYYFEMEDDELYCFELCFHCLNNPRLKSREILDGKCIFDSDTFLDKTYFDVTYDSRKVEWHE